MSVPTDRGSPPMAEPGKRKPGSDVGGMQASADAGVADSLQRSSERADEPPVGRASTGDASGGGAGPRIDLGGKNAPGSAPGAADRKDRPASDDRAASNASSRGAAPNRGGAGATSNDDDEDEWRHEPIAPIDEGNPLKSLGQAVGDTVTGSGPDAATPTSTSTPKTPPTRSR